MKDHCRSVSRALICEQIILVKDGPRGRNAATKGMIAPVFGEGLSVVLVKNIHGEQRLIECAIPTFGQLRDSPKWLKE